MRRKLTAISLCIIILVTCCACKSSTNDAKGLTGNNPAGIEVYYGEKSITNVTMGACENGEQKALCRIKMPMDYSIISFFMDKDGAYKNMIETNGQTISEVMNAGLFEHTNIPSTIVLTTKDDAEATYTFSIMNSSVLSIESAKVLGYEEGYNIADDVGNPHPAYVYRCTRPWTKGCNYDIGFRYKIDEDWTLLIEYKGNLRNKMTTQQLGHLFYDLVSPIAEETA